MGFVDKKVDHLILLVGGNPLPNYVAAKLLVKPKGVLSLIHSEETGLTSTRLECCLKKQPELVGVTIAQKQVVEADPTAIHKGITDRLNQADRNSVGLNYTGGTKAMAVHAYHALRRWASERRVSPRYSYLDARRIGMVFDPRSPETGEACLFEPLNQIGENGRFPVELDIRDMLKLHDWQLDSSRKESILIDAAEALLSVNRDIIAAGEWLTWKHEHLSPLKDWNTRTGWTDDSKLRDTCLPVPAAPELQNVVTILLASLKLTPGARCIPLIRAAVGAGFVSAGDLCQWLDGGWLESVVLQRLRDAQAVLLTREPLINVYPRKEHTRFEIDVVTTRGIQLFAVACSTDAGHFPLKHKLFEAVVRARQMGGDEARIALVCCNDHPDWLEAEMRREVDPHVKVFGRDQLGTLDKELSEWIGKPTGACT